MNEETCISLAEDQLLNDIGIMREKSCGNSKSTVVSYRFLENFGPCSGGFTVRTMVTSFR